LRSLFKKPVSEVCLRSLFKKSGGVQKSLRIKHQLEPQIKDITSHTGPCKTLYDPIRKIRPTIEAKTAGERSNASRFLDKPVIGKKYRLRSRFKKTSLRYG